MTKSGLDHIIAVVKAGVSGVPVIGGPLASLIGDYVPDSTSRSVNEALRLFTERLRAMEDRIDVLAVDREEFAELFKSAYLVMMRAHQEERRRVAVNLIVNILLKPDDPHRLSYTELDHFARSPDALSIGALRCAAEIYRGVSPLKAGEEVRLERLNFEDLARRLPDYDADLVMGLLGELNAQNIIHLPGAPPVRTEHYGNYPIERTGLGSRFVVRLLAEGNYVT